MKKLFAAYVLSICLAGSAAGGLGSRINGIIKQSSQKNVRFGIQIIEAGSGKTVYRHNAREAMIPASNMKIITSAAALKYLGPNYEFRTRVGLCGNTLVVAGGGDPLLGDKATDEKYGRGVGWMFEDITEALKRNGVRKVNDIVVDSSIFDDERVHPSWPRDELNRYYACEVSGLNFNGNCIDITTKNTGGRVEVVVEPETGFVNVVNEVTAIRKGKSAVGAYRNEEINKIVIRGKCRRQAGPFAVAIERPAVFFGYLLAEHLGRAGIDAKGQLLEKSAPANCKMKILREYRTTMSDCLARCNKDSFGLAAESLVKTMAAEAGQEGRGGSWSKGRELIERYMLGLGIDRSEFNIDDGSGLSRENRLSANAITKVLRDVYKSRNRQLYKESLAVGGVDGTIARYFKEQKYKGKILGKTGYIEKAKTFSGVCTAGGKD
ncbi:MAG: D-alanyl-D-alanine carboxypeptidase/D-alanyl-D-alanine-endopeptidase [Planctomycetota bacterium]|nr:MAG: D-alanyl-D-alanine carboxypeptidase/D-alanyl-D-alanine-endopeptidase [Planctomycetota bacterium]